MDLHSINWHVLIPSVVAAIAIAFLICKKPQIGLPITEILKDFIWISSGFCAVVWLFYHSDHNPTTLEATRSLIVCIVATIPVILKAGGLIKELLKDHALLWLLLVGAIGWILLWFTPGTDIWVAAICMFLGVLLGLFIRKEQKRP